MFCLDTKVFTIVVDTFIATQKIRHVMCDIDNVSFLGIIYNEFTSLQMRLHDEPVVLFVNGTVTGVVTILVSEATSAAEIINLAKKNLNHSVGNAGGVAG